MFEVLCLELLRFENRNLFWRKWCARLWLQGISKFQAGTYLTISYVEKYAFVSWHSNIKFLFPAGVCSIFCAQTSRWARNLKQNSLSFYRSTYEQRKKAWLFRVYRGLSYPLMWGLFHKPQRRCLDFRQKKHHNGVGDLIFVRGEVNNCLASTS